MYSNVGKKIMVIAQVIGWLSLTAGFILWVVFLSDGYSGTSLTGWLSLLGGVIVFLSSWFLYGFGQLVDDVRAIRSTPKDANKQVISDELPDL